MKLFILSLLAIAATAVPLRTQIELEPVGIREVLPRDAMELGPREPVCTSKVTIYLDTDAQFHLTCSKITAGIHRTAPRYHQCTRWQMKTTSKH